MTLLGKIFALFVGRERVLALLLLGLLFLAAALETIGVGLIMPFIAVVTDPGIVERNELLGGLRDLLGGSDHRTFLIQCGVLLLLYYVAKNAFLAVLTYGQYRFVYGKMLRLARRLLAAYLTAPYAFHLRKNSAELQRNVNTDLPTAFNWVVAQAFVLVSDILIITVMSALLVAISPVASLAALGVLGGLSFAYVKVVRSRTQDFGRREQRSFGQMVKWVSQGLGALKETRVRGVERFFVERYDEECAEYTRARRVLQTANEAPRLLLETVAVSGVVLVMIVIIAQGGETSTMVPMVALFGAAAFRLLPALTRIIRSLHLIRHYSPAFETVYADLELLESVPDAVLATPDPDQPRLPLRKRLELHDVHFGYDAAAAPVLRGLSLSVERGQCVGIVGASGAGKTTVVDLVLGLFRPTGGRVLVDGRDIGEDLAGWRRNFGYIPQEIYLTDDTIRRNVAFGVEDAAIDDEAVWAALRAARLDELVRSLAGGLDHEVGERGVRLSGGQRQRLGIARALYHDPEVLVMDEATSALDTRTEREITETTLGLAGSRTVIVIAHRLTTVQGCDRLFLLESGRLAASGTFDELVAESAEFRRLASVEA
jgi:ATP-binding cassette subfamily C protein